jgi:glycosyltransferase involved in cell wall biosynthesis
MAKVDVVIPVYNEERVLAQSVASLREFLKENLPHQCTIVIADNASTDNTLAIASELAEKYPDIEYLHLAEKGRGRALRRAWTVSDADIVSYMDVDLSTNLHAFPLLIEAIADEGYDVAIGSRLMRASRIRRSLRREILSRGYNYLVKGMFLTKFSDAQCGFKALSKQAARILVPLVEDQSWFFDTELLIMAEKRGCRIKEVPVEWIEDLDSRVNVPKTVIEDVRGLIRVRLRRSN